METFYHGSSVLFDHFDLDHALEGDGKVKFGYGVYVTESYRTAAHYAYNKNRPENNDFYVYTVEIPSFTEDNHLFSCLPVHPNIIQRTSKALNCEIPEEACQKGKEFRKYVGNYLTGKTGTLKQMIGKADLEAEKKAAQFFDSIGLDFFVWPQAQTNVHGLTNRAVMNEGKVRIMKIEKVQLDARHQLIEGSQQLIKEF